MNIDVDLSDDDLSSAMGTETLLARDLVPEALLTAEQQVHHIGGIRYLVVDQSANRRHTSKVSEICFLNPTQRRDFFDDAWVGKLEPWVEVMANCRDI
jgi:hypothetical protein